MRYTVVLEQSEEGFSVSVLGLPGCHSQGDTEQAALRNISDAIHEYLEVVEKSTRHNPVNAITMGKIIRDAGLTNEEFRRLL